MYGLSMPGWGEDVGDRTVQHLEDRGRRRWPLFVMPALVVLLAAGWTIFWYVASARIEREIEAWRVREAEAGRAYTCASQEIGGFPFRFELRCDGAGLTLTASEPHAVVSAQSLLAVAQVYDPTLMIVELTGPARVSSGGPAAYQAEWKLAQASVRGTPANPQRVSIALSEPRISEIGAGNATPILTAKHLELHGRLIGGTVRDRPVIELASRVEAATAPLLHPLAMQPFDGTSVIVLKGLKDFSPKPWAERFRELQQEGGTLQVMQSRFSQGEVLGVAGGTLRLTPSGHLSGELDMTVAGVDKLLAALGIDKLLQGGAAQNGNAQVAPGIDAGQINSAIGALDRLVPGLGDVARRHVNQGLVVGAALIGEPANLDGKPASRFTLRLDDGAVFLGPFKIGQTPALF